MTIDFRDVPHCTEYTIQIGLYLTSNCLQVCSKQRILGQLSQRNASSTVHNTDGTERRHYLVLQTTISISHEASQNTLLCSLRSTTSIRCHLPSLPEREHRTQREPGARPQKGHCAVGRRERVQGPPYTDVEPGHELDRPRRKEEGGGRRRKEVQD
ncbi:hypothetical protein BDP81DRAFT_160347 [Colletotrichum phormii]|uniref:Uncharacterized protein n=1 Tax=Colletotrichum phormii TaxID=359342 RepID=A0AAJ0EHB3_9PEZI|nr:uncharacterized protein BDP81DRAFT_160347 [Colletotrichum phormii]KAK1640252.1 hypothetical protein BDP81DRAFT_160347 [Colletotrichum phormii]